MLRMFNYISGLYLVNNYNFVRFNYNQYNLTNYKDFLTN